MQSDQEYEYTFLTKNVSDSAMQIDELLNDRKLEYNRIADQQNSIIL